MDERNSFAIYIHVLHVNIVYIIIYRPECALFRVLYNIYDNVYVCAAYKYDGAYTFYATGLECSARIVVVLSRRDVIEI